MKIVAKYIHGSEDSLDVDVFYVVDKITSFNDAKAFCDSYTDENVNIITIENGLVTDCYKGTVDEIQNSLFRTYKLHKQTSELLIYEPVKRDVFVKTVRVVRCFLSHLSRTQYRKEVKLALQKPDWKLKIDTLKNIDYNVIDNFKEKREDILKVFSFQLAQGLGLLLDIEIYTKKEASDNFPTLKKYLYREKESDITDLVNQLNIFLNYCKYLSEIDKYIDLKTEKRK